MAVGVDPPPRRSFAPFFGAKENTFGGGEREFTRELTSELIAQPHVGLHEGVLDALVEVAVRRPFFAL